MRTREFNQEVLYPDEKFVRVSGEDIATLIERAEANERKRMRLCAHQDAGDALHEMLIVHTCDTYVRPHKHARKSESFHVIAGRVDMITFNDDGAIKACIEMGDYASGLDFYYRSDEALYHTILIRSDVLVFHEVTNGPFDPKESLFAPWAPDGTKPEQTAAYLADLDAALTEFLTRKGRGG